MKKRRFFIYTLLLFLVEAAVFLAAALEKPETDQDPVAVNEVLQLVQTGWGESGCTEKMEAANGNQAGSDSAADWQKRPEGLDFVVLNLEGTVLYRTKAGLSESVHEAVRHRDTILDVEMDGSRVGKLIVYNDSGKALRAGKVRTLVFLAFFMLFQWLLLLGHFFYLDHTVVRPFRKLEGFAERIAGGNLEIPLEMDRKNRFGAFTEAFDLMRSELKKARLAEAKANAEKKELPLLKEKFKRGKNAGDVPGAGLGLSIADYFMEEMGGALDVGNGQDGLKVSVRIRFSGS